MNDYCLFAGVETIGQTFILVGFDDTIVASGNMTVISDVQKALKATYYMGDYTDF